MKHAHIAHPHIMHNRRFQNQDWARAFVQIKKHQQQSQLKNDYEHKSLGKT